MGHNEGSPRNEVYIALKFTYYYTKNPEDITH